MYYPNTTLLRTRSNNATFISIRKWVVSHNIYNYYATINRVDDNDDKRTADGLGKRLDNRFV